MTRGRKGAPKHKWTCEEEAALKAGVDKHGAGKWRIILSDPDFESVLKSRSNVDLKDKWRNISVTNFWGSRKRAKDAAGRSTALTIASPPPPAEPSVDEMILEAIKQLKKPNGSNERSIIFFIEKKFNTSRKDLKRYVTSRLKHLTNTGTLVKVRQTYRISSGLATEAKPKSPQLLLEGNKGTGENEARIKGLTEQEAVEAAARAVAEADFAIGEAEKAAREAEKAEAKAEAAETFAEAIKEVFKYRVHSRTW